MNASVYKIQKISNEKTEDIFFHFGGLKENSIKLSKNQDLQYSFETKLSWEDEIYIKLSCQEASYVEREIQSISIIKKKRALTFTHKNASILNEIFGILKSKTCLKNFDSHFINIKMLGKGTYGTVYLSTSLLDRKNYATKWISLNTFDQKDKSLLALKNEIQILRQINHPNIIKLFAVYRKNKNFQLIFDFIEGKSLKEHVLKNGSLSMLESLILLETLINIAQYLKKHRIIHRDIKPENIMIKDSKISRENIILIDFGLSEFVSDSYDNLRCGTPGFIAPEILKLKNNDFHFYDEKSDIFGIGITWYYSLFGKIPYKNQDQASILHDNKICKFHFEEKNPKYEEIKNLFATFLEADPKKRFDLNNMQPNFFFDLYSKNDYNEVEENDINRASVNITLFNMKKVGCNKNSFMPSVKTPSVQTVKKAFDNDSNDSILQIKKNMDYLILPSKSLF